MRKKYVRMIAVYYTNDDTLKCPIRQQELMEFSGCTMLYIMSLDGTEHWINMREVRSFRTFDQLEVTGV